MFTRPEALTDELIASTLAAWWGIPVEESEYLAVGFGSHHWAIRTPEGVRWFLTVDDLEAKRHSRAEPLTGARYRLNAALTTARRLREGGLDFVVAPVATSAGAVLAPIGGRFEAALYPWIEGRTDSYGEYTSNSDRREVVALLGNLHSSDLSNVPEARRDDFAVPNREELMRAIEEVGRPWDTGPFAEPARQLLRARASEVESLLQRYEQLVDGAREVPDRVAVTHGEPHAANTIVTATGRVLIDWDTTLIAPPERDLWMIVHGDDAAAAAYEALTGVRPRPPLLNMYRMLWDLMEIAGYTTFFRQSHSDTADAAESWKNLNEYLDISRRWPLER